MMAPSAVLKLSPSAVTAYDDCPRAYKYKYVDRVELVEKSSNLLFGSAVDTVFEQIVRGIVSGTPLPSPSIAFEAAFQEQFSFGGRIKYSKGFEKDDLFEIGKRLVEDFAVKYPRFGLQPIVDDQNNPIMQKYLQVEVDEGVLLTGKLDHLAIDRMGRVVVIDFKTARTAADKGFVLVSDQLTSYQILVDAHREELGIDRVQRLGFIEGIKRKVSTTNRGSGPFIEEPLYADRRTDAEIEEFLDKVRWVADDIRKGRFPKKPRMAYNTPCAMCDFAEACQQGNKQSLVFPPMFSLAESTGEPIMMTVLDDDTPAVIPASWF